MRADRMSRSDRLLRALKREGGTATSKRLGEVLQLGNKVNKLLHSMAQKGLVRRTGEKDGRSPYWEVCDE